MYFLLRTKGSHESARFDTSQCSDEYLPNSTCYFPNYKSVFLHILHDSLVPWNITPLYFFRSNVVCFAQKGPVKVQISKTFQCLDQKSPNSCHFWNKKLSFSSNFEPLFSIMRHNSLFSWNFIDFQQKELSVRTYVQTYFLQLELDYSCKLCIRVSENIIWQKK